MVELPVPCRLPDRGAALKAAEGYGCNGALKAPLSCGRLCGLKGARRWLLCGGSIRAREKLDWGTRIWAGRPNRHAGRVRSQGRGARGVAE